MAKLTIADLTADEQEIYDLSTEVERQQFLKDVATSHNTATDPQVADYVNTAINWVFGEHFIPLIILVVVIIVLVKMFRWLQLGGVVKSTFLVVVVLTLLGSFLIGGIGQFLNIMVMIGILSVMYVGLFGQAGGSTAHELSKIAIPEKVWRWLWFNKEEQVAWEKKQAEAAKKKKGTAHDDHGSSH